jgi:peptide/nickel transport system substrate-binding protein
LTWLEFMFVQENGQPTSYKPPFDDIRLRQAVAYAIDPQQIITGVLQGLGIPDNTPMPVGVPGYDPAIGEQYGFKYDPERARALIQEAGDPGEITIWSFLDEESRAIAQLIQNQLQMVGFTAKLEFVEEGVWVEDSASDNPSHHIAVPVGFAGTDPDFLYTMTDWTEGIGLYFKYNAEFRDLVTRARETLDMDARLKLYDEAQRLMLEDASFVPLYSVIAPTAVRTNVKNFALGPYGRYYFQDVYIEG